MARAAAGLALLALAFPVLALASGGVVHRVEAGHAEEAEGRHEVPLSTSSNATLHHSDEGGHGQEAGIDGHGAEARGHGVEPGAEAEGHGAKAHGVGCGHRPHGAWHPKGYEYSFVETCVSIVLLTMALGFEKCWHHLYEYVGCESHAHKEEDARHLFRDLMNRAGGEFMTLGFLAFSIFVFSSVGGFDWAFYHIHDHNFSLPTSVHDWLHMSEVVHMQLFIGMIIYFLVIIRTVSGGVRTIRHWEEMEKLAKENVAEEPPRLIDGEIMEEEMQAKDTEVSAAQGKQQQGSEAGQALYKFECWRKYFIVKMVERYSKSPTTFKDLFEHLGIDSMEVDAAEQFQTQMETHLSFSRYLIANIATGIRDSIEIHTKTWLCMIVLFGIFGTFHRFGHMQFQQHLMPFIVSTAVILLCVMQVAASREMSKLHEKVSKQVRSPLCRANSYKTGDWPRINERFNTELTMLRGLQVMLFLISYCLARTLLDVEDWREDPISQMFISVSWGAILVVLAFWLPSAVPLFLGVMAMPPYVDEDNLKVFCEVLIHGKQERFVRHYRDIQRSAREEGQEALVDEMMVARTATSSKGSWGSDRSFASPSPARRSVSGGEGQELRHRTPVTGEMRLAVAPTPGSGGSSGREVRVSVM